MALPSAGDIVLTRIITHQWGRNTKTDFWWRILNWDSGVPIELWCNDVAFRYLTALIGFLNQQVLITCVRFRNLSHDEGFTDARVMVTGANGPPDVRVCQATLWTSRYGIDSSGNARSSVFPISCIAVNSTRGRVEGNGQPPGLELFLSAEQIFAPLFPTTWVGGFISRSDGSFVQTQRSHTNPVVMALKTRSRRMITQYLEG